MSRIFKVAALFALIACGVWITVLWHWQATSRDIGTRDIVVYLLALPVTLFVFALLLRWAWVGVADKQAQRSAASDAAADAGPAAGATKDDPERHATWQLLGAHLVCAAGDSASALQAAAKDGAPRPALDTELRDADGLPIITARIQDLDTAAFATTLEAPLQSVRARRPEWAELAPGDHVVRALAALERPLVAAVDSLLPWSVRFVAEPSARGTGGAQAAPAPERRVRVLLGWPADWSAFEQELARLCVLDGLATSGGSLIPAACFAVTVHAGSGEELLLHADRLLQTLAREGRDEPLIVAACHSAIGDAAVEVMERAGSLYGAQRPRGQMPGEAAAALVLAGADWPAAPEAAADASQPHLHRPTLLRRDKSIDAAGRVNAEVVSQSISHALATARIGADQLAGAVCDADLHTARTAEFYGASMGLLSALDSTEDMRLLATVTGAVGVVSALLVVACAAERAVSAEKPQLAVTLGDAFARLALIAWPARPPVPAGSENVATKPGGKERAA